MTNDELRDRVLPLVSASQNGNEEAWTELVDLLSPMVWSVARGMGLPMQDAVDVSQTTWLQFARHVGTLREPEKVPGWLAVTARRECQRYLQKRQHELLTTPADLARALRTESPEDAVEAEAQRHLLWECVDELEQPCRSLVRMFLADPPPSYETVAETFSISVNAVGAKRTRCINHLRKILKRRVAEPEPSTGASSVATTVATTVATNVARTA